MRDLSSVGNSCLIPGGHSRDVPLSNKSLTVVASATLSACLLAGGIATIASTLPAEEGATVLPVDGVTGTPRDSIADDTQGPQVGSEENSSPLSAQATEAPTEPTPAEETPTPSTPEASTPATAPVTVEVPPAAPVAAATPEVTPTSGHRFDGEAFVSSLHNYATRLGSVDCPEWLRAAGASFISSAVDREKPAQGGGTGKLSGPASTTTPTPVPSGKVPANTSTVPTDSAAPTDDGTKQKRTTSSHHNTTHQPAQQQPAQQQTQQPEPQPTRSWGGSDRGWQKQSTPQQGSDRGHRDSGGWGGQHRGGGRG